MKLKGNISQFGEGIPMANVYVSDSAGKFEAGSKGTAADVNGNYSIDVYSSDYVTASFAGNKKTVKVSSICSGTSSCSYNFDLKGNTLEAVNIVANKENPIDKKTDWKKIALISGVSIVALIAIIYGIKKLKN